MRECVLCGVLWPDGLLCPACADDCVFWRAEDRLENERRSGPSLRFNAGAGVAAKELGMAVAAENRSYWLELARDAARSIALSRPDRLCNADLVQRVLKDCYPDYETDMLGPAAGSIFRGDEWTATKTYTKSERVSNHARIIWWWQYG